MTALSLFKLEKLKIYAFKTAERDAEVGNFEAMFNPESFKQVHGIEYSNEQAMASTGAESPYSRTYPSDLKLKLVLDGSGVSEMGIVTLLGDVKTVPERIKEFTKLCVDMNGETHEPNYLRVLWGEINFDGRLSTVEINYTSFDRDGKALRAELDVTFISDKEVTKRLQEENRSSPDLTHKRLVKNGDTLPLLSKEIYGSSEHYLFIAEQNRLNDFRNLTPGQELFFPPLLKQ